MPDPGLSVVMPAYEETANLARLLPLLNAELGRLGIRYEILVVDTPAERDGTKAVCAGNANVVYIPRRGGEMYGHAVRTGIEDARGACIIFMDADGSHNPAFLPQLWAQRDAADLIIASRYIPGGATQNPAVLILMSLAVNVIFRLVLGLKCADVSNSLRLYRAAQIKKLELECDHFDIVEEILVKLAYSQDAFRIKEIPFTFEKRQEGKTKRKLVSFALGYLGTLHRLYKMKQDVKARKRMAA